MQESRAMKERGRPKTLRRARVMLNVTVDPDVKARLDKVAAEQHSSVSRLLRIALLNYIDAISPHSKQEVA